MIPALSPEGPGFLNDVIAQKAVLDLKANVLKWLLLEKVVLWGAGWRAEQSGSSFHFHLLYPFL